MKKTLIVFLFYLVVYPFIPFGHLILSAEPKTSQAERSGWCPNPGEAIEVSHVKGKSRNYTSPESSELPVRIEVCLADEKGVFYRDEPISATLHIINETSEEIKACVVTKIKLDISKRGTEKKTRVIIPAGGTIDQVISQKVAEPGFYRVEATVVYEKKIATETVFILGYKPDEMEVKSSAPADYKLFWKNSLVELAKVDPNYTLKLVPERCTSKLNFYEVRMKSFGNVEVGGQYVVPKAPGKYPVIVQFLGYGSDPCAPEMVDDGFIRYIASTRGQGVMKKDNIYGEWLAYRLDNRDEYYFRGAFLDVVRAIDFVCSCPEVDQARIVAAGGSQGGALAYAAAALDKRVALCLPNFPGFCDIPNFINMTAWPGGVYKKYVSDNDKGVSFQSMCDMLAYFDVKNFGPLIHCPVFMGVGLQDPICPPRTNFAPYNLLTVKDKHYVIYPECGHAVRNADYLPKADAWVRTYFGMQKR
jgi:cephalosporin-C deacetylase